MLCRFNSRDRKYKKPFGGVRAGENTDFFIEIESDIYPRDVVLIIRKEDEDIEHIPMEYIEMKDGFSSFRVSFTPMTAGLYFYKFGLDSNLGYKEIKNSGNGNASFDEGRYEYQLTAYNPFSETEKFFGDVFYQIFPDRFNCSGKTYKNVPEDRILVSDKTATPTFLPNENGIVENKDFFCGDFKGIEEKLGYLKELGVNTIYLNPIFESQSNHRYDTSDYFKPDPLLGTENDFISLTDAIHRHGMKLILDGVFSHTGDDSVYFNKYGRYNSLGAYQSQKSPYYEWYNFTDWPENYDSWWGIKILPEVNENNPGFTEFVCGEHGVINYWLSRGADGFRLDVADELPDEFLENIYKAVKSIKKDAIVIGEVWEDATNKVSYGHRRRFLLGDQMDSVMNYPFKSAVINLVKNGDCVGFADSVMSVLENYPPYAVRNFMNFLSTHDTERIITALSGEDVCGRDKLWQSTKELSENELILGSRMVKVAYTVLYFLPGNPQIYYGDEVGMDGYADPFNRKYYSDKNDLFGLSDYMKTLGKVRNENKEFLSFADTVIEPECDGICAIKRILNDREILVCINVSKDARDLDFILKNEGKYDLSISSENVENLVLKPMSAAIFNISTF